MVAVIPLRAQSQYSELRYALRALCGQYPRADVIIIGPKLPDWITGVTHIEYPDATSYEWKSKNIFDKTMTALALTGKVLFMNDDHYILAPVYYDHHIGSLTDHIKRRNPLGIYTHTLKNTLDAVGEVNNFDTHCPIWYTREGLSKLSTLDWSKPHGYGIKTAYAAMNGIEGEYYPDWKFHDKIEDVRSRLYFTTEDTCQLQGLQQLFPTKSKFEA